MPNVIVQVDLVGASARTGDAADRHGWPIQDRSCPSGPAFASGELEPGVPPFARTLTVEATPQADKLEPGGRPARPAWSRTPRASRSPDAELAVAVVDEAMLALTGYDLPDPLDQRSTREREPR